MESYRCSVDSHVTQFVNMLTNIMAGLPVRNVQKKSAMFVKLTDDTLTGETAEDLNEDNKYMLDATLPLRKLMIETSTTFDETYFT